MAAEGVGAVVKRRLLGVGFIALVAALIGTTIAIYNKAFTPVVDVTLLTDHTGNQLIKDSDVKVRGIIVGSVRQISANGDGAKLTLAIDPSDTKLIPSNVSAQLLPKTLFGERYVDLVIPDNPAQPIKAGDTIQQDKSQASIETQQALADLMPVLQAVQPAELNATLTALATALRNRGTELGQNLTNLDSYLQQLNPSVPQLATDLGKLGRVATIYTNALPDLLDMLTNLQTTAATLTSHQAALDALLRNGTSTATVLDGFLSDNGQRMINVAASSNQILGLLASYAPEFPCMAAGLAAQEPQLEQVFHNNRLNITLQVIKQRGKYVPGNQPVLVTGYGPSCFGLPNPVKPFPIPDKFKNLNDGAPLVGGPETGAQPEVDKSALDQQGMGTLADTAVINSLIAPTLDRPAPDVPAIATVLAGPLLRGNTVELNQ